MKGLTEGRIVHYVPNEHEGFRSPKEHRPAIIVKLWENGGGTLGCAQLQVFIDGTNDMPGESAPAVWRTSVLYNADCKPGTWHWIERAED